MFRYCRPAGDRLEASLAVEQLETRAVPAAAGTDMPAADPTPPAATPDATAVVPGNPTTLAEGAQQSLALAGAVASGPTPAPTEAVVLADLSPAQGLLDRSVVPAPVTTANPLLALSPVETALAYGTGALNGSVNPATLRPLAALSRLEGGIEEVVPDREAERVRETVEGLVDALRGALVLGDDEASKERA